MIKIVKNKNEIENVPEPVNECLLSCPQKLENKIFKTKLR